MFSSTISAMAATGRTLAIVEPVTGMAFEADRGRMAGGAAQPVQLARPARSPAASQ